MVSAPSPPFFPFKVIYGLSRNWAARVLKRH